LSGNDAFQETDVFGLTLSLTKWSRLVKSIEEIPSAIAEGFYWAREGRPGPVVIDIPTDFLKAKMEFAGPVKFAPQPRPSDAPSEAAFGDDLIALLQQAKKPVALIGAGANFREQFNRGSFDYLNIPAFATVHGLGAVPSVPYSSAWSAWHPPPTWRHENDLLLFFARWMTA
jgi:acetolactate synthase-1/2/3 large subunit